MRSLTPGYAVRKGNDMTDAATQIQPCGGTILIVDDTSANLGVVVDSLALGAIPAILEQHRSRLRIVALMHLPLAADVGIDGAMAAQFAMAERRALGAASLVIVTGRTTLNKCGFAATDLRPPDGPRLLHGDHSIEFRPRLSAKVPESTALRHFLAFGRPAAGVRIRAV